METLHLNLKKKWFDMILNGIKKTEYRDLTNFWLKRLFKHTVIDSETNKPEDKAITYGTLAHNSDLMISEILPKSKIKTITFSNGYRKDRPQFEIELYKIEIKTGVELWGAEKYKKYFCLHLGEIINVKNTNLL